MTLSQQLREAGEKATPGEWRVSGAAMDGFKPVMAPGGLIVALLSTLAGNQSDAALIVLLRNNLDTIIAALEAQEAGK